MICNIESRAQFFHSLDFNNGIALSQVTENPIYSANNPNNPVISQSEKDLIFIGLATAIKLNYYNHKYWNLSSEIGFMELSQKNKNVYYINTNVENIQYTNLSINMFHFNTLLELKYPNWKIVPSLKMGARLDYSVLNINNVFDLNKYNHGFVLGIGFGYQLNNNLNFQLDFLNNWYKKDVKNASHNFGDYPMPV